MKDLIEEILATEKSVYGVEDRKKIIQRLKAELAQIFNEEGRSERYREKQREIRHYEWG